MTKTDQNFVQLVALFF